MAEKTPFSILEEDMKKKTVQGRDYKLIYDSTSETLEPIYFWILDFVNEVLGGKVTKITDNFASSPGSGHFSELMGKATRMQEEGMKVMQTIGVLIKSLINIVYDLRQFEITLNDYKEAKSSDKDKAEAALLALKQKWLDNVDVKRGNTSIKGMAFSNAAFATLIDAFMVAKSVKQAKEMDLNDRVKRILEQRILEFIKWRDLSEKELTKRYKIEKAWLKNQVNSLKLYSKWAKPYLEAAEQLSMKDVDNAALVRAFNTIAMQLTLFQRKEINYVQASLDGDLPKDFAKMKIKRKYYSCVLIDFKFRGIPQKAGQHYVFGGRAEVTFKPYSLNEEEIALFEKELKKTELNDALDMVEKVTNETLDEIREDLEYFLKEDEDREIEEYKEEKEKDVNPFTALFGFKKKPKEKENKGKKQEKKITSMKQIKSDNYAESVIRKYAGKDAQAKSYLVYDIYKKAHGMASTRDSI